MWPLLREHISRHVALGDEAFLRIESVLQERRYRKRQYLLQQGDACRFEFFVLEGCFKSSFTDDEGQEHVVQFAIEDWWIGDLSAFITGSPASYSIDCLETGRVLLLEKQALEQLYRDIPELERFFRIIIQNAYVSHERRVLAAMTQTGKERYLNFLEKYPRLAQRIPDRYIASFLNMKPESLSRIRRKLSRS